ncbi:hypothetical protein KI387_008731 [Taxus chinensis]|uniref:Protein kinase domain-containing protein n=1 Tax=Taxus chinensis TaxID=29808 RepID=A0AA38CU49_TAXCH|nr:hypothetical protein KI387_008731 [Taxus chinensis]
MAKFIFSKLIFLACLFHSANTVSSLIHAGQSEEALSFNFTEIGACGGDEISCVGDATVSDHVLHLTNSTTSKYTNWGNQTAGRVVYDRTVQLSSIADFSTHFRFPMNYSGQRKRDYMGDGIAFFLAYKRSAYNVPQYTSGGWFGLVGDKLDAFPPFFAVALSSYDAVVGTVPKSISEYGFSKNATFRGLNNGTVWDAWIDYNSSTEMLQVHIASGSHSQKSQNNLILKQSVNLSEYLHGNVVFIGLSSAAVNSSETHDIFSWSFKSSATTVPVQKRRRKVRISTKIILSVGSVVAACLAGTLLLWSYFVRRKRLASIRRQELADTNLEEILHHIPKRFNMDDLTAGTNNFSETEKLGQGGFGAVYKCILLKTNEIVAVKRIKEGSRQGIKEFISEVSIVSRLRHRNLVQLLGWCHEREQLLLVYEYMPNGSLDRHLFARDEEEEERKFPVLQWSLRYKIAREIASALLYLHEEWDQCVVHRDVKSSNVMLDSKFSAKLGDFGLARLVNHEHLAQTTQAAGTLGYLAPECVASGKTSPESDVYSFGAVALELASGKRAVDVRLLDFDMRLVVWAWDLYGKGRLLEAADMRLNGEFEKLEMEQLIVVGLWCSHPDAASRPKMRQVLKLLNFEVTAPHLPPEIPVPSYNAHVSFMTRPSSVSSCTSASESVPTISSQVDSKLAR